MGRRCKRNPSKTATPIAGQVQVRLQTLESASNSPELSIQFSDVGTTPDTITSTYFLLRGNKLNMTKLEHAPKSHLYLRSVGSCFVTTKFFCNKLYGTVEPHSMERHSKIKLPNNTDDFCMLVSDTTREQTTTR